MAQMFKPSSESLEKQIRNRISSRVLFSSFLLFGLLIALTIYDLSVSFLQLRRNIEQNCKDLENYVISQDIVKNDFAIQAELNELNNNLETINYNWIRTSITNLKPHYSWHFPYYLTYYYPLRSVAGESFGYFKVAASFLSVKTLLYELMIRVILIVFFASLILLLLKPLVKRIPRCLFIEPINRLIKLLENHDGVDLKVQPEVSIEIREIEEKISSLITQVKNQTKRAALGQVASQVAHDIRSPLAALDTIFRDISEFSAEKKTIIRNATNRIKDIANNLLLNYKNSILEIEQPNQLNKVSGIPILLMIERLIAEKRIEYKNKKIEIYTDFDTDAYLNFADIDYSKLNRIISNLINNSVEACTDSGLITLKIITNKDNFKIFVKDNGCGISEEDLNNIFRYGKTTKKDKGYGLGLAYAKEIIESSNGKISIVSKVMEGAVVQIDLPRIAKPMWYPDAIYINRKTEITILDEERLIRNLCDKYFIEFNRLSAEDLVINNFHNYLDFIHWFQSLRDTQNILFLIGSESDQNLISGFEIIKNLNISNNSILFANNYDEIMFNNSFDLEYKLKVYPKEILRYLPVKIIEDPDLIFLDDNITLTDAWKMRCELIGKNIITFNSINELFINIEKYNKTTPIYIDSDLNSDLRGEEVAKILFSKGYINLFLTTGREIDDCLETSGITKIVNKECPF